MFGQFLSFSCSFRQKSCQKIGFCLKLRGWPPRLGNLKSATGSCAKCSLTQQEVSLQFSSQTSSSSVSLFNRCQHDLGLPLQRHQHFLTDDPFILFLPTLKNKIKSKIEQCNLLLINICRYLNSYQFAFIVV